jgi:RNA polymerase sigma-70 factor (ECF subfamily)
MSSSNVPLAIVKSQPEGPAPRERAPGANLDFAALYDAWFDHVARFLKVLGAPDADHEDLAQEVFLVVRRRLVDFDGQNVAGWLYQIARRQVLRHRRLGWVKRVFTASASGALEDLPQLGHCPLATLETKEKTQLLWHLLLKMSEKRRVVFALYEVEGYGGEEIASFLDVPLNTVWTRLHHARKDFYKLLGSYKRAEGEGERWNG